MNLARNLFHTYNKYVIKYPLIGMAITSGFLIFHYRFVFHFISNQIIFRSRHGSWKSNLSIDYI